MEADAKRKRPAMLRGHGLRRGDLLRNVFRRLAPREVDVHVLGRDDAPGARRAAKVEWRIWLLLRRIEQLALLNSQVLVCLGDLLPLHQFPPDGQELVGDLITFVVIEKDAITLEFGWIPASDDVDEQSSVRQAVKRGRRARGKGRLGKARPHRDQEPQATGEGDHRGGDDPRVLARAAGGKEHAVIAELIRSPGNLRQIAERYVSGADLAAEIP